MSRIYEFTTASGQKYVGQSNDIARRLGEHGKVGRLDDVVEIKFKEVNAVGGLTAKQSREIAEQLQIEKTLGRKVQDGVTTNILQNKVNPIGRSREGLLNANRHLLE